MKIIIQENNQVMDVKRHPFSHLLRSNSNYVVFFKAIKSFDNRKTKKFATLMFPQKVFFF